MTGVVAWFTGLPSSGKSTLAAAVVVELRQHGILPVLLDSDHLRAAMVPSPSYDQESRANFYATLARLGALIARQGHVVLISATAHRRAYRDDARRLAPRFVEIFVDTPIEECRRRDTKGLYAANIAAVPGVGVTYEPPLSPDFIVTPVDNAAPQIAESLRHL